jgi:hypothetical protein
MQKQVLHNQSLLDISLQNNGTVMSVFELAHKNGISITEALTPGQNIEVPERGAIDTTIVTFYQNKNQIIATGLSNSGNVDILPRLGIGTMIIGTTFIVGLE